MVIYKVQQGKVEVGKFDFVGVPLVEYFQSYGDALKMRGNHGGTVTKYEDCHDTAFANREVWIERNIKDQFLDLVDNDLPKTHLQTIIHQIEVK